MAGRGSLDQGILCQVRQPSSRRIETSGEGTGGASAEGNAVATDRIALIRPTKNSAQASPYRLFRPSTLGLKFVAGTGLGSGQAGSQYPKGRTGNVIHPYRMAELNRGGVATVLAAYADLEIRTGLAPAFDSDSNQLAHTGAINHLKRILLEYAFVKIDGQELIDIVT